MITDATSAPHESVASVAFSYANKENYNPKTTQLINHDGYCYTKKIVAKKHTLYYCRNNRGGKNKQCSATLKLSRYNEVLSVNGEHGYKCKVDNPTLNTGEVEEIIRKSEDVDFSTTMHKRVIEIAVNDVGLKPEQIWNKINAEMNQKADVWSGLTDAQVKDLVRNTRKKNSGSDIIRELESPPLSMVHDGTRLFLQFNSSISNHKDNTFDRVIGWGHPALFGLLRVKMCQLFIDGTFSIVPYPFYQCLVIMVFDQATGKFLLFIVTTVDNFMTPYHFFFSKKVYTFLFFIF